jgi:hypothetical protein
MSGSFVTLNFNKYDDEQVANVHGFLLRVLRKNKFNNNTFGTKYFYISLYVNIKQL